MWEESGHFEGVRRLQEVAVGVVDLGLLGVYNWGWWVYGMDEVGSRRTHFGPFVVGVDGVDVLGWLR